MSGSQKGTQVEVRSSTNGNSAERSNSYSSTQMTTTTSSRQVNLQKVTVLREITSKVTSSYRRELGQSSSEVIEDATEAGVVLDWIASERLRCMPHSGSRYDKVLRWAEYFVRQVSSYSDAVGEFVMCSTEAARLIYGSCLILLQLGEDHVDLLDKLFGIFYKFALSMTLFIQHTELLYESSQAQSSCAFAFASLLNVTANSMIYFTRKATTSSTQIRSGEFEERFGRDVESFYYQRNVSMVAMWTSSISEMRSEDVTFDVATIRRFLSPQDRVTQALMSDRISSRHSRAEYTCEWASKRLTDFARSKDGIFLITGREYSGKSVLSGWIVERTRNTSGRLAHEVIAFDVDTAIRSQMSPLAAIQGLVLQIFERNVGDVELFMAISAALRSSGQGKPDSEIEDALWHALDVGLNEVGKLMIVVDGIDQFGEAASLHFLERLNAVISKHEHVKGIALSRPLSKATPKYAKLFTLEPEQTREDMGYFIQDRLSASAGFSKMKPEQRHAITDKISTSANGSFTWADLTIELVKTEKTYSGITKMLDGLPKSVKEVINRLVATVDLSGKECRSILAWMLAAERPLLLNEIKQLLEIDISNMTHAPRFTSIEEDLRNACGGLVDIRDGIVRFRTLAIRHHLTELAGSVADFTNSGKFPFHIKEASYDLCLRSLAYVKIVFDRQLQISTTFLSYKELNEFFDEYVLLEYASRYWISHFQRSPMFEPNGKHKLTTGFKSTIPDSVAHTLIEGTCVRSQYSLTEAYDLLLLSLKLRETIVGEMSETVLQALINVAILRQRVTTKEVNDYYYRAWKLSRTNLGDTSTVTISCAREYIESTKTVKITERTEVEEVLLYLIDIQKQTYGVSHEYTITYMKRLAEYYTEIKETTKASSIYREIYEITVTRYGHQHKDTQHVYTQLKRVSKPEEFQKITYQHHKSVEREVPITDSRRITGTRDMVERYEKEKDFTKAEETMVNYWREISEASRTTKDVKVREQQVDATIEYVKFLNRQKRSEEATNILNGLYLELDHDTSVSQSKVTWIHRIADQLKAMGSTSSSRRVYSSLWTYYRSSGQQTTKEAKEIAQQLSETTEETTETPETTTRQSREEMLREILESSLMTSTTTVEITTIRTAKEVINIYTRQEKHDDVIEVCRDVLRILWPSVLTGQKDVKLPSQYQREAVDFAETLARAYFKQHYVEETTQTYYSIFQGFRSSPKKHTAELQKYATVLIEHYKSIYRPNDAISTYQALYEALVEVYGSTHHLVIETLYSKAELEFRQNKRKSAQATYEKIYSSLKGSSDICQKEGIRAGLLLCNFYEKEQKWDQARSVYQVLWHTFLKKGKEYDLGVDFVDQIFDRYLFILENRTQSDYKEIRALASEYRETCIKFYGKDSERTLTSSMRLAALNEKEDSHKDEAIAIYEFVLDTFQNSKKISNTTTSENIATSRQRLAPLYSSRGITHDRAQSLYRDEFESSKEERGHSHKQTIDWLSLLITCYQKRNTPESTKSAAQTLQDISVYIILNEKDSTKLYESSQAIAKIYTSQDIKEPSANDFLAELRRHVVSGESNISSLKGKTTDRRAYVFVVGFEETVRDLHGQFSVLMSELMSESLMTEAYLKSRREKASFDTVFGAGTRLRVFLKSRQRKDYTRIEEQLFEIFTQVIVGKHQIEKSIVREVFDIVIEENGKDQQDVVVLQKITSMVFKATNSSQFERAYHLAILADAYTHHYDSFRSQSKIETGFKLCLYLTGHNTKKCQDAQLNQVMVQLSGALLKEVLEACKEIRLNLIGLPFEELNAVCGMLGEQHNYLELEWILHDLWVSRHSQSQWPPSTTVSIGRKLVECRFLMGSKDSAIHLAEDICYNLRRVWGPLDKTTLEMTSLIGEMYTAMGAHAKAMGVYEEVLNQIISDEIDLDQVTSEEEGQIVVRHLNLLKHSYQRAGGWPAEKDSSSYVDLSKALQDAVGNESSWKNAKVESVEKWSSKGFKEDNVGTWKAPSSFEFLSETEKRRKHMNVMRRVSTGPGSPNGLAGGNSPRLIRSKGFEPPMSPKTPTKGRMSGGGSISNGSPGKVSVNGGGK